MEIRISEQKILVSKIEEILAIRKLDSIFDIHKLESEIDHLIYKIYKLTEDEIKIIEKY